MIIRVNASSPQKELLLGQPIENQLYSVTPAWIRAMLYVAIGKTSRGCNNFPVYRDIFHCEKQNFNILSEGLFDFFCNKKPLS